MLMFVPAGSPIFFSREHRFAVLCRVVTLRQLLWTLFTLLFMLSTCLLHIFLYIFFINIGCATLYHLSMMYVTVYNMSFNSNCRILAADRNYRFTILLFYLLFYYIYLFISSKDNVCKCPSVSLKWSLRAVASIQIVVIDYTLTTDNS